MESGILMQTTIPCIFVKRLKISVALTPLLSFGMYVESFEYEFFNTTEN